MPHKHDDVCLHRCDDEAVQVFSENEADRGPNQGQQDIFPENVGRHFPVIKAQDLDGCQLPPPFGDVDIVQVVKNDKGQHCCSRHNNQGNNVKAV